MAESQSTKKPTACLDGGRYEWPCPLAWFCAPDQDAVDIQRHLGCVFIDKAWIGDERVGFVGEKIRIVSVVYPRLYLSAVLARRHRSCRRGEADLQISIGQMDGCAQNDELAGDVGAVHLSIVARERQRVRGGLIGEPVADGDGAERRRHFAGVADFVVRVELVIDFVSIV